MRAYAELLRAYTIRRVVADRYAAGWAQERWVAAGIQCQASEYTKSELHVRLLPMLNSGRCVLLDHPRLANQLLSLERRVVRGSSREVIDSPPKLHEDLANAAAGALVLASRRRAGGSVVYLEAPRSNRPLLPLPAYQPRPWTYGSPMPCPLPAHLRRTR